MSPSRPKDADGRGEVIAKGYSSGDDADGEAAPAEGDPRYALDPGEVDSEASGRDPEQGGNAEPDGAAETEVGPAATTAPSAACTTAPAEPAPPLPTPPVEPPEDLDPENADEDFDGIPDETERATYEQQLAEYEAAVAAQAGRRRRPPPAELARAPRGRLGDVRHTCGVSTPFFRSRHFGCARLRRNRSNHLHFEHDPRRRRPHE